MQVVQVRSRRPSRPLIGERVGALVVSGENFFLTQRDRLVELAADQAVPTIYAYREFVTAGGLMSYGASVSDANRRVGVNTGRILKGAKPADLPVEQITKIEFIIRAPRKILLAKSLRI